MPAITQNATVGVWGRPQLRPGFSRMSREYISFYVFGCEPLISAHSHSQETSAASSALGKRDVA